MLCREILESEMNSELLDWEASTSEKMVTKAWFTLDLWYPYAQIFIIFLVIDFSHLGPIWKLEVKTSKVYEKWFEKVVKGPNVSWANRCKVTFTNSSWYFRVIVKILNFDHHGPFVVFRGFQHSAFRHRSPPNLGFQSMKKKKLLGGIVVNLIMKINFKQNQSTRKAQSEKKIWKWEFKDDKRNKKHTTEDHKIC